MDEDVKLLQVIADEGILALLGALSDGPRSQAELAAEVGLSQATVSRYLARLQDLGLLERSRSRGPYTLRYREKVDELLLSAADLAAWIAQDRAAVATEKAKSRRKSRMSGEPIARAERSRS